MPLIGTPEAGYYKMRLRKGAIEVPVMIWFGQAIIDGELQDRSLDWRCAIDGQTCFWEHDKDTGYICLVPLEVWDAWPDCCGEPISKAEYLFLLRRRRWAVEHRPDHPAANPLRPIELGKLPPLW